MHEPSEYRFAAIIKIPGKTYVYWMAYVAFFIEGPVLRIEGSSPEW